MTVEAVIGANYGDEGKGLFTEYLCRSRPKPLVVMSNGGCQRGHTVNNAEKSIRHVFHHFGSGTLLGVPTLYSKTFLLNPMMFADEYHVLEDDGVTPNAYRMPGCTLQLPSDMFINQQLEKHRSMSGGRHGSCGWGIWETVVRNRDFKPLTFEEFAALDMPAKKKLMNDAFDWQVENRLKCEDGICIDDSLESLVRSEGFINHFISDFMMMERLVPSLEELKSDDVVELAANAGYETVIVENAQGLLLDMQYAPPDASGKTAVHATPSKTGLKGAAEALGSFKCIEDIIPNYITRSYLTRHGAGPFPEETAGLSYPDETNAPNEWQGSLRFGKIDFDNAAALFARTSADAHSCGCVPRLAVTHLNEARSMHLEDAANCFSYEDDSSKVKERTMFT